MGTRAPLEILAHIGDLFERGLTTAQGETAWPGHSPGEWDHEVVRFFAALQRLDERLGSEAPLGVEAEKMFQGPIADALTHVGQLGMLRRMAGGAVRGENNLIARKENMMKMTNIPDAMAQLERQFKQR